MLNPDISSIENQERFLQGEEKKEFSLLLAQIKPLIFRVSRSNLPSNTDYETLLVAMMNHPEGLWLLERWLRQLDGAVDAETGQGSSSTQTELSLKKIPELPASEKNMKLNLALQRLEQKKSAVHRLMAQKKNKIRPQPSPKLIAALDAVLDFITGLFAEPEKKLKKRSFLKVQPRPAGY